jgi:hypothetical protein
VVTVEQSIFPALIGGHLHLVWGVPLLHCTARARLPSVDLLFIETVTCQICTKNGRIETVAPYPNSNES